MALIWTANPSPQCVSLTAVGRLAWIDSLDAWDCAQVLVDGAYVVVFQPLVTGPRHDLEKISVDWVRRVRWKAVCGYGSRAIWMKVIKIFARPEGGEKLFKRAIPFRQSGFGRWR